MILLKEINSKTMQKIEDILKRLNRIGDVRNYTEDQVINYIEEEFDIEKPCICYDYVTFEIDNIVLKYSLIRDNQICPYEYETISNMKLNRISESIILEQYNSGYFAELYAHGENYVIYEKPDGISLYKAKTKDIKLMYKVFQNIQKMFSTCLENGILPVDLVSNDIYFDKKGNIKVLSTQSFIYLKDIEEKCPNFLEEKNPLEASLYCINSFAEYGL